MGQVNGSPHFGPIDLGGGSDGIRDQVIAMMRQQMGSGPQAEQMMAKKTQKMGGASTPDPVNPNVPQASNQFFTPQASGDRAQLLETMMKRAKGGGGTPTGMAAAPGNGVVIR
jgi:hypothetical protein